MESEEDHSKRSKIQFFQEPSKDSPFPSTSMQDSTPTLPPELITEIFSRLPVKSLLQFRCVSKYWLAEISRPQFIKTHLSLAFNNKEYTHHMLLYIPQPGLPLKSCTLRSLFCQNVTESIDLDCPMKYNYLYEKFPSPDWIVGSVNWLICFAAGKDLFIGNPSIRKYRKLPYPRPILMKSVRVRRYSFGYDEFHGDYKVVGVFTSYCISDQDEIHIYSLKNDSWRRVDDCPSEILLHCPGVFLNGKLHWDTSARSLNVYNGDNICSFDLTDEKWRKTVEQPSYRGGHFHFWLTVLASDLSILCDYGGTRIDVWVMKEYGVKESWTIMFTIKCPGNELGIDSLSHPLIFMSKKGEILVVFGTDSMIYNPKDESIRYSAISNFDHDYEAEIYIESLISPFLTQEREDATKKQKAEKPQIKIIE